MYIFIILIHSWTIVTVSHKFRDQNDCLLKMDQICLSNSTQTSMAMTNLFAYDMFV